MLLGFFFCLFLLQLSLIHRLSADDVSVFLPARIPDENVGKEKRGT